MVKSLENWLEEDVAPFRDRSVAWLSQFHFFRDPIRPTYTDLDYFFSPADGIILYQRQAKPDEALLSLKGKRYSPREALRHPEFDSECLAIGIFMTFYDVHVNRIPYPGQICYRALDAIDTFNHPMLEVEKCILERLRVPADTLEYLHHNQRVVSRIYSSHLGQHYYVLQIADYDVDCITPFELRQNQSVLQGERFSMVRYGSQVDLIVPLSSRYEFAALCSVGDHVEAGVDPLIRVMAKRQRGVQDHERHNQEE